MNWYHLLVLDAGCIGLMFLGLHFKNIKAVSLPMKYIFIIQRYLDDSYKAEYIPFHNLSRYEFLYVVFGPL